MGLRGSVHTARPGFLALTPFVGLNPLKFPNFVSQSPGLFSMDGSAMFTTRVDPTSLKVADESTQERPVYCQGSLAASFEFNFLVLLTV